MTIGIKVGHLGKSLQDEMFGGFEFEFEQKLAYCILLPLATLSRLTKALSFSLDDL